MSRYRYDKEQVDLQQFLCIFCMRYLDSVGYNLSKESEEGEYMYENLTKGTVEWDGKKVTIEGSEEFVSTELANFRDAALRVGGNSNAEERSAAQDGKPQTDASFLSQKMPKDHYEKIAVLAVRLKETGKDDFNADDMRRAYLRAGVKPPKALGQALVDAKRYRDFVEPATARGSYRLTNHGEDFVRFELPRQGAAQK
jgi:hypothetical protein